MPQNTKLLNVTAITLTFPKDGNGGATTEYATNKTTGSTTVTYTATTATFGAVAAMNGGTAGDYVVTSSGEWGVLVSSTTTVVTVDKWRSAGNPSGNDTPVIPASGAARSLTIYQGKNIDVGTRRIRIIRINFSKSHAGDTIALTDAKGTAVFTYTAADSTVPFPLDLSDGAGGGYPIEGPWGVKLGAVTSPCMVVWVDAN